MQSGITSYERVIGNEENHFTALYLYGWDSASAQRIVQAMHELNEETYDIVKHNEDFHHCTVLIDELSEDELKHLRQFQHVDCWCIIEELDDKFVFRFKEYIHCFCLHADLTLNNIEWSRNRNVVEIRKESLKDATKLENFKWLTNQYASHIQDRSI